MDLEEGTRLIPQNATPSQWRRKCCRVLKLSLSLFVFLLSFVAALYFGVIMSQTAGTPFSNEALACLVPALISSTLFVFWLTESDSSDESNVAAIPIRVASVENYQTLLQKSLSDQGKTVESGDSNLSLPLLLISTETRLSQASTASLTESLDKGSPQDSEMQGMSESLQTKNGEGAESKDSSYTSCSETAEKEEVRQRKVTPPVQKVDEVQ